MRPELASVRPRCLGTSERAGGWGGGSGGGGVGRQRRDGGRGNFMYDPMMQI
jgi:hypothetical protein